LASLVREGIGPGGPTDYACSFCPNTSTQVSTSFSGGFPPPSDPVGLPANSEIGGTAFANLATGLTRGSSHSVSYGHFEQHEIRFVSRMEESLEIDLPAGLPAAQRFITLIGEVHANAYAVNRASGTAGYSLQVGNVIAHASLDHATGWNVSASENNPAIEITPLVTGYRFKVTSSIPGSRKVLIATQLEGTA